MKPGTIYLLTAFLGLYAFMLARSRELKIHQVILIALGGFLLAFTPLGYPVWLLILAIGKGLGA
ncbi:hypothetical protein [Streptomyces lasiicapitis]|uniref:Uncharacterized protein n=1 Tax=Streptomyces lasiicapitis TaxID=1923961 RepID=A0ABQ2LIH2_9ACTN|nr:hypothetical protein [Streptomyces lasiicapitis]GGO35642.1 hypothetical protein GCM10012286_06640 [Streptomyces lasiicapitis]